MSPPGPSVQRLRNHRADPSSRLDAPAIGGRANAVGNLWIDDRRDVHRRSSSEQIRLMMQRLETTAYRGPAGFSSSCGCRGRCVRGRPDVLPGLPFTQH